MPPARSHRRGLPLVLAALALLGTCASWRSAVAQTTGTVTLAWTAPGDDGTVGRASRYEMRYSTGTITGTDTTSWWNAATIVNMVGRVPAAPGVSESVVINGLALGVRYYAILRTADEVPNWSWYSNAASFLVTDSTPPRQVVDLNAR
jgi:hypothetical protein